LLLIVIGLAVMTTASAVWGANVTPQQLKPPQKSAPSAAEISEARQRLAELGYWVKLEVARLDDSLRHALIAFQKIEGRPRTGQLTSAELQALRAARRPLPLEAGYPHIEVDLSRQVLFVVDVGGAGLRILPISSGNREPFTSEGETRRAITPLGRFTVYRQLAGWRRSPLGLLFYPNYIFKGIAIHGNPSVPAYPASHGCIRIPMFAAEEFSQIVYIGTVVIIHDGALLMPNEA
jgi:lipoprotein-anchoring transpeptidase ErfK/SrfK